MPVRRSPAPSVCPVTKRLGRRWKFDGLEFLALLSSHVTKPYESVTRYFGFYSCRVRGERNKQAPTESLVSTSALEPAAKASSSWAACIKRVLEINPLECPLCKSEMRIVAFIQDQKEISRFMRSRNIPDFQAPPPLPRAPPHIQDLDFPQYFD